MYFLEFLGYCISQVFHLLDFKILGFNISVIYILLGCFALTSLIVFLRDVTGVIARTSSFDNRGFRSNVNRNNSDYTPRHAHTSSLRNARHIKGGN